MRAEFCAILCADDLACVQIITTVDRNVNSHFTRYSCEKIVFCDEKKSKLKMFDKIFKKLLTKENGCGILPR